MSSLYKKSASGSGFGMTRDKNAHVWRKLATLRENVARPEKKKRVQEYYDPNYRPKIKGSYMTSKTLTPNEIRCLDRNRDFIKARMRYYMKLMLLRHQDARADEMPSLDTLKRLAIKAREDALHKLNGTYIKL